MTTTINSGLNSETTEQHVHHQLKCLVEFYQHVIDGSKTFEVRKNDRNFKVGDTITLYEVFPKSPHRSGPDLINTGRYKNFQITYILQGERWGIQEGYCVLGLGK